MQGIVNNEKRDYAATIAKHNFLSRELETSINKANREHKYFWKCAAFMLISGFVNVASFFWSYWVLTH